MEQKETVSYRVPQVGEILFDRDDLIPIEVTEVNNGKITGTNPFGEVFVYPIEADLLTMDDFSI
jgi:hypothetical protein